jgi:hypothetical protein
MPTRHHRRLRICLAAAAAAFVAAFALSGWRLLETVHRTLEIFYGDRGDPVPAPDLGAVLLAASGCALLVGAVAFAVSARRAALALERASLIETQG